MALLLLRGELIGEVEAVLFDKDGTLSVSEPGLHALATARVFHCDQLLRQHDEALHARLGPQLRDLLQRAYGLRGSGLDPAGTTAVASRAHNLISTATALAQLGLGWPESVELSEATFLATDHLQGHGSARQAQATEGLHALVKRLAEAAVTCAVISNDETAGIEAFLSSQGLRRHFQAIWSAEHSPRKPDPAAVLALCRDLGVQPQRCALIGDANSDLLMARRAGLPLAVGYLAGWGSPPPLDPTFPHMRHWEELEVLLR
ncbi:HAD family hydrolase [Cyanobium sp. NIES-981]|uniref:HAD family hydrolase n=1 Tax=Cyanobium sp. NIES-981 TaxID=1851505 RepID=UPI0007DDFB03|nr:HAD family hydrolase [Cyanobium sp. NIES-981]SBO43485.1 Haloacid dehalogenase/epoxide hydrolase family [Cyanobium sp. NIES-981]